MNILRRLLTNFKPKAMEPVAKQNQIWTEPCDYTKWSKTQLVKRIQELEQAQNGAGTEPKNENNTDRQITDATNKPKVKQFDFSKYSTRFVALKFSYLGWNYNGLAIQNHETTLPTVEETIIKALHKCRMIPSLDPKDFNFSRCGRTDKGVSAMNQVISLNVRSNLKTKEEQMDPANDNKEVNYVHILNKLVPKDIRFKAVCLRPPSGFDARFSCQYRRYKYFFHKKDLDIDAMQEAAAKYQGDHDFRNFCKIDGSKQITNFKRTIISSKIIPYVDPVIESNGDTEFYVFDLIGSAFLWHQVRCMIAVLFLVGSKLEKAEIIDYLFDVASNPQRPVYNMAHDIPLVLYDCKFPENVEWKVASDLKDTAVYENWLDFKLKSNINTLLSSDLLKLNNEGNKGEKAIINIGDGKGRPVKEYVPLERRPKMLSAEEQNAKFKIKKRKIK